MILSKLENRNDNVIVEGDFEGLGVCFGTARNSSKGACHLDVM